MPVVHLVAETVQPIPVSNIFCVGRNYAAHIAELGNRPAASPVVFLKPTSALNTSPIIALPSHSTCIHYETELVLLIGKGGKNIAEEDALTHLHAVGLGLDLTARDLQDQAKQAGLPWAISKGFDGSATVTSFVPADRVLDWNELSFSMHLNGVPKQTGRLSNMIYSVSYLVSYLSRVFALQAGDLVFTGTPEGVGPLHHGDVLQLKWADQVDQTFRVSDVQDEPV